MAENYIETRRLQRLLEPEYSNEQGLSFLGMLVEGQLSEPLRLTLKDMWSHDNMDAAEFENGDVGRAYEKMLRQPEKLCWDYACPQITLDESEKQELYRQAVEMEKAARPELGDAELDAIGKFVVDLYDNGAHTLYLLAPAHLIEPTRQLVIAEVENPRGSLLIQKSRMRQRMFLTHDRPQGWLDVDNGALIFADAGMFRKVAELFDAGCEYRIQAGLISLPQRPGLSSFRYIHRAPQAAAQAA